MNYSVVKFARHLTITDIQILRDGGTILFTLAATPNAGRYRLQTPFLGEPRPLFLNDRQLGLGSPAEQELVPQLQAWLRENMTAERQEALHQLDSLKEWRNLPRDLLDAVPLHRIRTVLDCLLKRSA
jgi:hypothetical protein